MMGAVSHAVLLALVAGALAQSCTLSQGKIIGQDSIQTLSTSSAGECCNKCTANIMCSAFTWDSKGHTCFLKDNTRGSTSNPDRVSGTVAGRSTGEACTQPQTKGLPFCNTALPIDQRVDDLVARIMLNESGHLLTARESIAIPRLGLPSYYWGTNAIHGLQNVDCLPSGQCPTSFPAPCALSAAFNDSLVHDMGTILGRELRAYYNGGFHNSLDTWSPTININRDPRWGRNVESPGEDPVVAGRYGSAYTKGLQEGPDPHYVQSVVTIKHWVAYSVENYDGMTRYAFNAIVSPYDLTMTYLPGWQAVVQTGHALGVMCSYNSLNGIPTCGNPALTNVLRGQWGFEGYMTSDSDSVACIWKDHHYEPTAVLAVRDALEAGCDIDSGNSYIDALEPAVQQGLVNQSYVAAALRNTFRMRMRLGLFDPDIPSPYKNISQDVVGSAGHQAVSLLAARKGMVLLKNAGNILPFPPGHSVAVIGESSNVGGDLLGNYVGPICPSGKLECVPSIFDAVKDFNKQGQVTNVADVTQVAQAVQAAQQADYVILVASNAHDGGGEGQDRYNISLAANQLTLVNAVLQVGKPTVLVLVNGGIIAIDGLAETAPAILEAFMPGVHGAQAIAETVFGLNNPGGKMPVTMYHSNYVNEVDFLNMSMTAGPGRSYRYYTGTPIYPFGYGLSYTTFRLDWTPQPPVHVVRDQADPITYQVNVTNTGAVAGDEVVLAYFKPPAELAAATGAPVVTRQLFDYQRVTLQPGDSTVLHFTTPAATLALAGADGSKRLHGGKYVIELSRGHGAVLEAAVDVAVEEPILVAEYPFKSA
eukprot:m.251131 g.251131  ORF g.251131 m.251131 type:complete len:817 (-) comp17080_c0_seq1:24-2474(-)